MNLLQLRNRLRTIIGSPTTTAVSDIRLSEIINQAYRDIGIKYRFHDARKLASFDTVIGTKRYTLPTDLNVLMKVWDQTNHKRLRKKTDRQFARIDAQTAEGLPQFYFRMKDWIELEPIPSMVATIVLHYKTVIADLVLDIDLPVLPLPWHIGIVYLGRKIYYDDAQDIGKALYASARWMEWAAAQPNEVDEESFADGDFAVELPELRSSNPRQDFDHDW